MQRARSGGGFLRRLAAALAVVALAGCGGAAGDEGSGPPASGSPEEATQVVEEQFVQPGGALAGYKVVDSKKVTIDGYGAFTVTLEKGGERKCVDVRFTRVGPQFDPGLRALGAAYDC